MYEITKYMDANTMGTAHLLEILAHGRHRPRKLIVASSMSIYGEGAYRTPGGEVVYPMLRSERTLQQRDWDRFDPFVDLLTPLPTDEEKPLRPTSIYAVSKRDQEEMCLSVGRAYGIPTVAFRFFNVYGPRQALSNPYTGVAAIFSGRLLNGKRAGDLRGRPPGPRLHQRQGHRAGPAAAARRPTPPTTSRSTSAPGGASACWTWPRP